MDCLRFLLEDCGAVPTAASACLYTADLFSFLRLSYTAHLSRFVAASGGQPSTAKETRNRIEPRALSLGACTSADPPRHGSTHAASTAQAPPEMNQSNPMSKTGSIRGGRVQYWSPVSRLVALA